MLGNKSHDSFKRCAAYGVTSQPVEEEMYIYVPVSSGQAKSAAPSHSPPQELGGDEHIYEIAHNTASAATPTTATPTTAPVTEEMIGHVSGQTKSAALSHSPPQELGGDEHIYEITYNTASAATPITATPTTVPVTEEMIGHVAVLTATPTTATPTTATPTEIIGHVAVLAEDKNNYYHID